MNIHSNKGKEKMRKIIIGFTTMLSIAMATPNIQNSVVLESEKGSLLDGSAWKSSTLQGKISVLVYVDPDTSSDNEIWEDMTKEADFFQYKNFQSIAMINMAATWSPDFAINLILENKKSNFPKTIYVRDLKKELVHTWGLSDDAYNILLINEKGELLLHSDSTLSKLETEAFINTVITLLKETK
jgi:uncharacterized protein